MGTGTDRAAGPALSLTMSPCPVKKSVTRMMTMTIFNAVAKDYDQWYATKMGRFVDAVETACAFELFTPEQGQSILDVGCGTGNFSVKLAEKGAFVTGIDVSEDMLEIAREKSGDLPITFKHMDLYELDFQDNTFDAVFSMAAFEFVKEPERALSELFRVLKPGGKLLIGTIHLDSPWGRLYTSEPFQKDTVFRHAALKTLEEMAAYYPDGLVRTRECLFTPPEAAETVLKPDSEAYYQAINRGGFICLLWEKPIETPLG